MSETYQFELPLVQAAQAQKHVTVNEALARLDAVAQLRLASGAVTVPPVSVADGVAYGVPVGAVNDWNGHTGEVAVFANGGWVFVTPRFGWQGWVEDLNARAVFDGVDWRIQASVVSAAGAGTLHKIVEFDHTVLAGATSTSVVDIASGEQVIGITGRILTGFTGTGLTGWDLGVSGATNRYGNGLVLAGNSWVRGLSGAPVTYYADTPLVLSAIGGDFAGGVIRLAVHSVALEPPLAV